MYRKKGMAGAKIAGILILMTLLAVVIGAIVPKIMLSVGQLWVILTGSEPTFVAPVEVGGIADLGCEGLRNYFETSSVPGSDIITAYEAYVGPRKCTKKNLAYSDYTLVLRSYFDYSILNKERVNLISDILNNKLKLTSETSKMDGDKDLESLFWGLYYRAFDIVNQGEIISWNIHPPKYQLALQIFDKKFTVEEINAEALYYKTELELRFGMLENSNGVRYVLNRELTVNDINHFGYSPIIKIRADNRESAKQAFEKYLEMRKSINLKHIVEAEKYLKLITESLDFEDSIGEDEKKILYLSNEGKKLEELAAKTDDFVVKEALLVKASMNYEKLDLEFSVEEQPSDLQKRLKATWDARLVHEAKLKVEVATKFKNSFDSIKRKKSNDGKVEQEKARILYDEALGYLENISVSSSQVDQEEIKKLKIEIVKAGDELLNCDDWVEPHGSSDDELTQSCLLSYSDLNTRCSITGAGFFAGYDKMLKRICVSVDSLSRNFESEPIVSVFENPEVKNHNRIWYTEAYGIAQSSYNDVLSVISEIKKMDKDSDAADIEKKRGEAKVALDNAIDILNPYTKIEGVTELIFNINKLGDDLLNCEEVVMMKNAISSNADRQKCLGSFENLNDRCIYTKSPMECSAPIN